MFRVKLSCKQQIWLFPATSRSSEFLQLNKKAANSQTQKKTQNSIRQICYFFETLKKLHFNQVPKHNIQSPLTYLG